jgi:hypothetical protein
VGRDLSSLFQPNTEDFYVVKIFSVFYRKTFMLSVLWFYSFFCNNISMDDMTWIINMDVLLSKKREYVLWRTNADMPITQGFLGIIPSYSSHRRNPLVQEKIRAWTTGSKD